MFDPEILGPTARQEGRHKGLSWMRRCLCQNKTLLLAFLLASLFLWYKILTSGDIDLEHNILYGDIDLDQSQDRRRTFQPMKNVSLFPVLPRDKFIRATRPTRLRIDDVIPNESNLVTRLKMALEAFSRERPLMISVVDYGFLDMTMNFLRYSIDPQGLVSSYLVVCIDSQSADVIAKSGYNSVHLDINFNGSSEASDFGTPGYYKKTNIKTWLVLQTLKLGFDVLLTDVDIVLFKDPFPYFPCPDCDVTIQMDKELYNSGFVYARATDRAIRLYEVAWDFYLDFHTGHDQAYINMAIRALEKNNNNSITIHALPWKQFPCGAYYFEHAYRHFYNLPACDECVMAHNNYMGSTSAKIYRFKENLMWLVDKEGYYTSKTEKYITYENPYDFGKETIDMEVNALLNAFVVAFLTGRVLILPSFRCCNCRIRSCDHPMNRCSLLSILNVKSFHETFAGKYREHSFLKNSQVPREVANSQSPILMLGISAFNRTFKDASKYVYTNQELSNTEHIELQSAQNLNDLLGKYSEYSVLRLHSLYGSWFNFREMDIWGRSVSKIQRDGITCASYEQWDETLTKKLFP